MQRNDAYSEPTVYHRVIGIPEQAVQLNRVYGLRREGCVRMDREENYERMYAATADSHVMFERNARKVEKCLNFAKPREYGPPAQQRGGNTYFEDSEHPYEYI